MATIKANDKPSNEGVLSSGSTISYWVDSVKPLKFSPLQENLETDVVIVGGGLAGITTAYCLTKSGRKVVLLEDGFLGSGETGRTTAHVVNALDDFYKDLESLFGEDGIKLAADSHTAAIDFIERTTKEESIECNFRRVEGYLFLHPSDERKTLEDELKASRRAGLNTFLLQEVPGIPFEKGPALHFPEQAQFHPLKYIAGLAESIMKNGGKIFTETHVNNFKKDGVTARGFTVTANHIVVATNTPVNNIVTMHTKQFPYRTFVIGTTVPRGSIQPALWWDTGDPEAKWVVKPYHYVRLQEFNEEYDLLISGGEDRKTGQADAEDILEEDRYNALEQWTRDRFPMIDKLVYKWSGQVMEPVDSLAFIGRNPGNDNIYIVTGDSGNGMTHTTIAGMLLTDLINGKENRWEKIYDPGRISLRAAGDFLKEMGNMVAQYGDYLSRSDIESAKDLGLGEGGVVTMGLRKVAVYKDIGGNINAYSAICPHLGCVLQWNDGEKSFDCPCHGSRFTYGGKVINGPAISDLERIEVTEKIKG